MKGLKYLFTLADNSRKQMLKLVLIGIVAGLASFMFITLVNRVIQLISNETLVMEYNRLILYFGITILIYFIARRMLSLSIIYLSQDVFWKIRKEIIKIALRSSYRKLIAEKNEIYSVLTSDVGNITAASFLIVDLIIASVMILFCFCYMIYLSPVLSLISICIIAFGVIVYRHTGSRLNALFVVSRSLEVGFLKYFNAVLSGAKEINVEPAKGEEIYSKRLKCIADEALENNKKAFLGYVNNEVIGQMLFNVLIGFIVLNAGIAFHIKGETVISFVLLLLYVLGPIENLMGALPALNKAVISAGRIAELKSGLEKEPGTMGSAISSVLHFEHLNIKNLEFKYLNSDNSFCVGPIDLSINKGEIIFIYGGNGSGKTTFLYTLLHLYTPTSGEIVVNETAISEKNVSEYQKLFAPVFSDFYLFDSFYGIENVDETKLSFYLNLFEIDKKVTILEGNYSTTDLSTGQKKRLALISALMEKKPLLVLDEWAADQDPYFRKKFYTEILPLLKQEGFTIFAITHDDNYYHCADKLYRMDVGSLSEQKITRPEISFVSI